MYGKYALIGLCAAVAWLQAVHAASNLDYCELENCKGRQHVSCEMPDGLFAEDCPDDVHLLNMRDRAQQVILDAHNRRRNEAAGGDISPLPKAAHMGTVGWNVTFANLARFNVRRCMPNIDGCRSTPDFDYVGQNVAFLRFDPNDGYQRLTELILQLIDSWFNQHEQLSTPDIIDSFQASSDRSVNYNSFAQLVRDYSTRVGCAAAIYSTPKVENSKTLLLTCNYDLGLTINYSVYKSTDGAAGSGCTTGTNPDYPNLCSVDEKWDVNRFYLLD